MTYKYNLFENTDCGNRRPSTAAQIREDWKQIQFEADNEFDALRKIIKEVGGYDDEDMEDYFMTIEDCINFLSDRDMSSGELIVCQVYENKRLIFDYGITLEDLLC